MPVEHGLRPQPPALQQIEKRLRGFQRFYRKYGKPFAVEGESKFAYQGSSATRSEHAVDPEQLSILERQIDQTSSWILTTGQPFEESELYEDALENGDLTPFEASQRFVKEMPHLEMRADHIPISTDVTSGKLFVEFNEKTQQRYIVFHVNHHNEFALSMNFFNPHTGSVKYTYSTGNALTPLEQMTPEECDVMGHYLTLCKSLFEKDGL